MFLKGRASALSGVHKQCHGMFSEQIKVCLTSKEIMKVLLLTISCFTLSCYSSRREVSHGPVSCLQALLAADPVLCEAVPGTDLPEIHPTFKFLETEN